MDNQRSARSRAEVINAIIDERAYQDAKFGPKNDQKNSIGDFLTYIHQYWDEASYKLTHGDRVGAMHVMRKITALGFAAMETHGALTRAREQEPPEAPTTYYDPEPAPAEASKQGELAFPSLTLPQRRFTGAA